MAVRICFASIVIFLVACAPTQNVPISLNILQPRDGDTIHVDSIPIEGIATVGALVHVSGTLNSNDTGFLFPLDNTGHFGGKLPIENMSGPYAAVFKVTKPGAISIVESRTVYYVTP